jgi:hypothetical protein
LALISVFVLSSVANSFQDNPARLAKILWQGGKKFGPFVKMTIYHSFYQKKTIFEPFQSQNL